MKEKLIATEKSVGFCYPTSPRAVELGYSGKGRWVVEGYNDCTCVSLLGHFSTEAEAFAFADLVPVPYSRWSRVPPMQQKSVKS